MKIFQSKIELYIITVSTLNKAILRKMTSQGTFDKALDRAHDGAEATKDAVKNLFEKAKDLTHDAAENIREPVNEAAKNFNEGAKEQWGKIIENFREENNNGNLILGVLFGVVSILFVFGVCKVVGYFKKPKNEEK